MATYKVRDPQGNIREISGPDGASDEEIISQAQRLFSATATAPPAAPSPQMGSMADQIPGVRAQSQVPLTNDAPNAIDKFILDKFGGQLAKAPDIQASVPGRFIQGMADLPVGAMQLGMNVAGMGDTVNPEIAAINQRTEALRRANAPQTLSGLITGEQPDPGFDWARLAGNIATAGALGAPKVAATAGQRIMQGVGMGAGYGAATPVSDAESVDDFRRQKARQISTGMAIGGAIPAVTNAVGGAYRVGRNLIDPWLPGGAERAAVRTAEQAAGSRAGDVAKALREFRPSVAGERVGAGEAAARAGSAEFSALQRIASERRPSEFAEMGRATNQARQAALRTVGRDKPALEAAIAERTSAAGPLYESARASSAPVNVSGVVGKIDDLISTNPGNRELVTELNNIRSGLMASARDIGFGKSASQAEAQKVSSVLDGIKASLANKENAFIKGQLNELKNSIADALPGYQIAQKVFAEKSIPVNQMQIGQFLENKLVPALNDQGASASQRGAAYAQALRDATGTIKRSTGSPRYEDIAEILSQPQMGAVRGVGESLGRQSSFEQLAKQGMPAAREIAGQVVPVAPAMGMFNPKYSVLKSISNRFAGRAEGKSLDRLAELMQDPRALGRLMQQASPAERSALAQALRDYS